MRRRCAECIANHGGHTHYWHFPNLVCKFVWLGVHSQAGWKDGSQRQWSSQSHDLYPGHGGRSSHARNTKASLSAWRTDYTCHHSHRLNEPPAKGGVWNGLPRLAHSHAVFGYKDFCGSTDLGTPESVGMNGQIDWQALQISHLVCSLAGQRCSEDWGTFSARTSQSITALTAWRKEEWRKEAADIPPSKAENDLCSTRQILALFRGQPWGD